MIPDAAGNQAVFCSCKTSSSFIFWRIRNFWILPVTVIGNSSTNRVARDLVVGDLALAKRPHIGLARLSSHKGTAHPSIAKPDYASKAFMFR